MEDFHQNRFDRSWWDKEITSAVNHPQPTASNLQITLDHYRLSRLLREITGEDAGANFHTWAVWGSKKAGETIRLEDTKFLRRIIGGISLAGAAALFALPAFSILSAALFICLITIGLALCTVPFILRKRLKKTAAYILEGNRTVLDDIGRVTAGFAEAFYRQPEMDERRLQDFLDSLRPGRAEEGGQSLLQRAFTNYYFARYETDPGKKHEHMLLGNCYAILHEHYRLQPFFNAAMPRLLSGLITRHLLIFRIGNENLCVNQDIPIHEADIFPPTLKDLNNPELLAFLYGDGWDRSPDSLQNSHAEDWSRIENRMNYIVDLFRSRHFHPQLFDFPFDTEIKFPFDAEIRPIDRQ